MNGTYKRARDLAVLGVLVPGFLGLVTVAQAARANHAQPARDMAAKPVLAGFSPNAAVRELSVEERLRRIPSSEQAEADLRYLTSAPHVAGTEASHRVAEWLLAKYRSYGFDARIITYRAWIPLPKEVKLDLISPLRESLARPEPPFPVDRSSYDGRDAIGFNSYSPSGDVTAPVVYANYGMQQDYRALEQMGISVRGKIVLARYGRSYRGIKAKLAEDHGAAALILYSDPADDGYAAGDEYPSGPWRPEGGIQRGSILYTQLYPGDPLSPVENGSAVTRVAPAEAANLPRIPTLPISARDAGAILANLGGAVAPEDWQGALPLTYHLGSGEARAHLKIVMDYQERPIYDVIATLRGSNDKQWVVLGNHHDAWVYGAADPASGTAVMLETARSLGKLARSGWEPRRTIVMCEWDGEEPGLIGSTKWVEANRAELQAKAVAYINVDVGITGRNFSASATPSLDTLVRNVTREVTDPATGGSVYDAWSAQAVQPANAGADTTQLSPSPKIDTLGDAPLGGLGAGSDFCPFLDYAGIPSIDMGFEGDYGVYHSVYDDFYWMKRFGDPGFHYHAALARILGTLALRLESADVLPYDFPIYAGQIAKAQAALVKSTSQPAESDALRGVTEAIGEFSQAADRASASLESLPAGAPLPADLNRELASVEQALLSPEGLAGRPWYKHTIYAPGLYSGYAAEMLPGIAEALKKHDQATLQREAAALEAALHRASEQLDSISRLAATAQLAANSIERAVQSQTAQDLPF